ncbi:DUF4440 domain-containing protein [Pontimicrobium aquaticum]|uniref:DUF4440 domain-containing protein n=2 Tax=Pontimicrobium aquaticum TaxID=2565367 RepID=A0A4U0EYH9_9FLAO|nr:DUF4440 domain-containing protein [Pontimicrobium aquaticum]
MVVFNFNKMKKYITVIALCALSFNTYSQDVYSKLQESLQEKLDDISKQEGISGITCSVIFDDEHQINIASGYSDIEKNKKMQPDTRMLAGSVGKLFFNLVILKQIELGKIHFEDKASKYLGETDWFNSFPNSSDIKIVHLLNHTSGLPRHVFQPEFLNELKENPLKHRTPIECIKYISNKEAVHPAGRGWSYSDTNFILLGIIVEKVTSKTMYDLIDEAIIKPLDLKNTNPSDKLKLANLAQGYVGRQNPFQVPKKILDENGDLTLNPSFEWAGGGYVTNTIELAKLIKYIHESDYLSEDIKNKMRTPVHMRSGQPYYSGYGLGSFIWDKGGDVRYGHSGFFPGHVSQVEYSKNNQYGIAIQINNDDQYQLMQKYIYELDQVIAEHLDDINVAEINKNFKKQEDCWNNDDIECYMKAYASNGDQIQTISTGGVTFGYDNIISDYKRYFPKGRMGKLHYDNVNIRKLSDNLYFVTGRFNLKFENREQLLRGWFSVTTKKINGKWYMITDHSS